MNERTANPSTETSKAQEIGLGDSVVAPLCGPVNPLPDSLGFASRRAARGKMQLWLTTFTLVAALAVLVVVSFSVFYAS